MPISDEQLQTWSHHGSITQSKATHEAIRAVLNSPESPYYLKSFDDFLQGSYANDTNIYSDSDVDIVIRLTSTFYHNTDDLQPGDQATYQRNRVPADYELSDFKRDVAAWLRRHYVGVTVGNKAIFIPGSGNRRDADVLVSAEHRHYTSYSGFMGPQYNEGIVFEAANGRRIVNYPRQHRENLSNKNQATGSWVKRTVRVFKNMRNRMIEEGYLDAGIAPSYFIEGLLYNVPNNQYGYSNLMSVTNCFNFIQNSNKDNLTCANELHWLVRDYQDVCWSIANYETFRTSLRLFWNNH
ncbi:nucleotidyltransferase domain-containing protein [Rhizobium ruizarguesonis]|uniref:nucleotidyltransferase domain-containing protein n=1 Tax=Rhizobium ruizarguesonis TaxID=2081791 RepID=UPI0010308BC0|nr:nucleotidyltransferase [Rhizobium ruizarguesonis]TBE06174.1 nucleotidyltransferase [Rhizobium ruizarguesonis]TBE77532.1 nucleotidyltransferase [Rhizobium ruizarguesonis]TBE87012.1 nucleotidyltransferase [Rhizobium ruizarguesonis]